MAKRMAQDRLTQLTGAVVDMLAALKAAANLFSKGHAIDNMNWGASCLTADNIRELNELPGMLQRAIDRAEGLDG